MSFFFVHCFVINLVNGLNRVLHKVLGLFYVKIHVPYILVYISRSLLRYQKPSKT